MKLQIYINCQEYINIKLLILHPIFLIQQYLRDILVKRISPYLVNSRKAAVKKSLAAWSWLISSADAFSEFSCQLTEEAVLEHEFYPRDSECVKNSPFNKRSLTPEFKQQFIHSLIDNLCLQKLFGSLSIQFSPGFL